MEKIAIISDIHANITALKATLEDIKKRNINRIFCLGDMVIKGASPAEVIDLIRENCEVVIKGNCDEAVCLPKVVEKKHWTRIKIGEERTNYIRNLPVMHEFYMSGYLIRLFHSSPFALDMICNPIFSNTSNDYAFSEITDPLKLFENTEFISRTSSDKVPDIVGYGHIHTPNLFRYKNKMIFNCGSVGASNEMLNLGNENDETNKFSTTASYIIIEGEYNSTTLSAISISNVRVAYDIQKEIEILEKSDFPLKNEAIFTLKTASTNYK